jgi:hypothetical protein
VEDLLFAAITNDHTGRIIEDYDVSDFNIPLARQYRDFVDQDLLAAFWELFREPGRVSRTVPIRTQGVPIRS